jgi:hypothetical protein
MTATFDLAPARELFDVCRIAGLKEMNRAGVVAVLGAADRVIDVYADERDPLAATLVQHAQTLVEYLIDDGPQQVDALGLSLRAVRLQLALSNTPT